MSDMVDGIPQYKHIINDQKGLISHDSYIAMFKKTVPKMLIYVSVSEKYSESMPFQLILVSLVNW